MSIGPGARMAKAPDRTGTDARFKSNYKFLSLRSVSRKNERSVVDV